MSWALVELAAVQVIAGIVFDFAVENAGVPRFAASASLAEFYRFNEALFFLEIASEDVLGNIVPRPCLVLPQSP